MKKIVTKLCLLLAMIGTSLSCSFGQLYTSDSLALDTVVHHGLLQNGLTYYIVKNKENNKSIELSLVEKAGMYHLDGSDDLGIAHFIEHLSLRSTLVFPNGIRDSLMSRGLTSGQNFGASTGVVTDYDLRVPTGDSVLLDFGLHVLRDWAKGRLYKSEEIEQERSAVLNEAAMAMTPSFFLLKQAKYWLLDSNNLYVPNLFEEVNNVKSVSVEKLKLYDDRWYRPDLQAVFVVGDIDVGRVESRVKNIFSSVKGGVKQECRLCDIYREYDTPLSNRNRVIVQQDAESRAIRVQIYQKRKSVISGNAGPSTLKEYRIVLMDRIYNEMVKNRLTLGLTRHGTGSFSVTHEVDRRAINSLAGIDALTTYITLSRSVDLKMSIEFTMEELFRIERYGFLQREFSQARKIVNERVKDEFSYRTSQDIKIALQKHFISGAAFPPNLAQELERICNGISLAQIDEFAKNWLGEDGNTNVLISVPAKTTLDWHSPEDVFFWMKEVRKRDIEPRVESEKVAFISAPKASKDNRILAINEKGAKALELVLKNGVKVLLKKVNATAPAGQSWGEVVLHGFSSEGTNFSAEGNPESARIAAELISYSGLERLDPKGLAEWMDDKNKEGYLFVGPYMNPSESGIVGASSLSNMEELFHLVYLYFVKPRKDRIIFNEKFKKDNANNAKPKSRREAFEDSVRSLIFLKSDQKVYGRANEVKLNAAFRAYRKRFSNAGEFTFVVTGFFDVDTAIDYAVRYLGGLPSSLNGKRVPHANSINKDSARIGPLRVTMVGDSVGNVDVRMLFSGTGVTAESDYLGLEVLNQVIQMKLFQRLRNEDRIVYGVSSSFLPLRQQGKFFIDISFQIAPELVDVAIESVLGELSDVSLGNIESTIVFSAIANVKRTMSLNSMSAQYWNDYLVSILMSEGKEIGDLVNKQSDLDLIDSMSISRLARLYIDVDCYSVFKLL